MKIFKEGCVFNLAQPVSGEVIGEQRQVFLPSSTSVTVVLVHGNTNQPVAYEVEAYLVEQDCYVLATIEATDI
jgi:hypothetical protein